MIGLDTNVIIRYLVQDDEAQSKKAAHFIEKHCNTETPGFLNSIVICELVWVLETCYQFNKIQISQTIENLLKCPQIELEFADAVWAALLQYKKSSADFSDALIGEINQQLNCTTTVTLDKAASKLQYFSAI